MGGVNRQLGGYHVTGIEKFANGDLKHLGKPKVQLTFYLDHNGILQLVKAEATLEETIMPKEENETAAANETDGTNATVDSDSEKTEAKNATTKTKPARKPKKKVHRRELSFKYIAPNNEGTVLAMSKEDKKEAIKRLKALQEADD